MNDWILTKHDEVREYIKDVIDVQDAEDKLQVTKYAHWARKEKAVIVIPLHDLCQVHKWLFDNRNEISESPQDPLNVILDEFDLARLQITLKFNWRLRTDSLLNLLNWKPKQISKQKQFQMQLRS
jgi:hypothetical protein